MEKSFPSANPGFMLLCVWLAISWCSTCCFIWPAAAPRIGGQLSSPAAEPGEFLCLLFLSLCGRKKSKKKKNWTAALLELLVKSGRQGRDEPMGGGGAEDKD